MEENKDMTYRDPSRNGRYAGRYSKQGPATRKPQKAKKFNPLFIAVIVLAIVLIGLIIFLIVGPSKQNNALIGTWRYDQYTEYEYKIAGDKLKLDFTEDIVRDCEYSFTVENNILTLVGGEGTDQGTYKLNKIS